MGVDGTVSLFFCYRKNLVRERFCMIFPKLFCSLIFYVYLRGKI